MSLSDQDFEEWKELAQHWRFTEHTAFRVQEHLESVLSTWGQVSRYLKSLKKKRTPPEIEQIQFVRHALLSKEDEARVDRKVRYGGTVALAQFAQSQYLDLLQRDPAQAKPWLEKLTESFENLRAWPAWDSFIERCKIDISRAQGEGIDFDLLKRTDWPNASKDQFEWVTNLYLLYTGVSHVGFLAHTINRYHHDSTTKPEKVAGYLMKLARGPSPRKIAELWRFTSGRDDFDLTPCVNLIGLEPDKQTVECILSERNNECDNSSLESFSGLVLALYCFFNRLPVPNLGDSRGTHSPRNEHHLVVPIYAWSQAPKDSDVFRHRGGALLGWAFHRFSEGVPRGWPKTKSQNVNPRMGAKRNLRQHVRSFSLLMEDFAVNYLAGETDWALSRPWGIRDTAESFMQRNFHHSYGWECVRIQSEQTANYYHQRCDPSKDEDGAHLRVNLDRHLPRRDAQASAAPKIAYLRPNQIALEANDSVADDYHAVVAERARQFYTAALRRRSDQTAGADATVGGYLHEIRNLGESVADAWLIDLSSKLRDSVNSCWTGSYSDLKEARWKMAPFPEVFDSMADAFGVWGRQDVFDVPGNSVNLAEIVKAAVDVASSCVRLRLFRGWSFEHSCDRDSARKTLEWLQSSSSLLKARAEESLREANCNRLQMLSNEPTCVRAFKRLLVRLAVEALIHADLSSVAVRVSPRASRGTSDLLWSNITRQNATSTEAREADSFLQKLSNNSDGITLDLASRGRDVLEALVVQLGGSVSHNFHKATVQKEFRAESLRIAFASPLDHISK